MKTVLIYSGGLDSTVALYYLTHHGDEVTCLTFDYGQRHRKEIEHASHIARTVKGCDWRLADLAGLKALFRGGVADHSTPIPEGHYADHTMRQTVSPNRNMIMLSIACGFAVANDLQSVAYAAHAGDHAIYPDCRPSFCDAMSMAMNAGNYQSLMFQVPLLYKSKADIVKMGVELGVPFGETWSCYNGRGQSCGRCGTCVERLEAFSIAGCEDPLPYEDWEFWKACVLRRDGRK